MPQLLSDENKKLEVTLEGFRLQERMQSRTFHISTGILKQRLEKMLISGQNEMHTAERVKSILKGTEF